MALHPSKSVPRSVFYPVPLPPGPPLAPQGPTASDLAGNSNPGVTECVVS